MAHELEVEVVPREKSDVVDGYRIVELSYVLDWALNLQSNHRSNCTFGELRLIEESRKNLGLISELTFKCDVCGFETKKKTEDPNRPKSNLNYAAVWGTLATGSTYTQLKEQHSCMDIPNMPYKMFHEIEVQLGDIWKDSLWLSMEEAGIEEHQLANQNGQVDSDGNPWISVFVDGGWSHRSYGHNYNASSGVVCARVIVD